MMQGNWVCLSVVAHLETDPLAWEAQGQELLPRFVMFACACAGNGLNAYHAAGSVCSLLCVLGPARRRPPSPPSLSVFVASPALCLAALPCPARACYSPARARQLASLSIAASSSAAPVRPSARGQTARLALLSPPSNGELDASHCRPPPHSGQHGGRRLRGIACQLQ